MSCVLTQNLICVQAGLLTAAIIITALQEMRVNAQYFQVRQMNTTKRTRFWFRLWDADSPTSY